MNLSADRQGRIDNVHSRDAFYRNIWDGIPYFSNRSNRKGIYSEIIRETCLPVGRSARNKFQFASTIFLLCVKGSFNVLIFAKPPYTFFTR